MISRKTILILMHNDATQFIDIANQYVHLFDKNKFKVIVAYLSGNPSETVRKRTLSEEVIFLNFSKKSIRGVKLTPIKKLLMLCREKKFSIVICHRYKPIYIMLWVAQFCHIPLLFFVMHAMHTLNALSRKLLITTLFKKNMYFAGVSNAVRDDLRSQLRWIPAERIITLYNCIDIPLTEKKLLSCAEARNTLGLSHEAVVVGTIGRLAPEKDQQNMLRAFALCKSHFPHLKCVLIGDGPLEKELKILVKQLNLTEDVIFTGFMPEAFRYAKAFDIFILSSTKEAFGRVLLEAMVAKIPVIGTRTHGIPEVIGNAGKIVEPCNPQQLAYAMEEIIQENKLQAGEKVYQQVKENFSFEQFHHLFWSMSEVERLPCLNHRRPVACPRDPAP